MKLIIIFKIDIPLIVNDLNIIKKQFSICIQANTAVNCFVGNIHIINSVNTSTLFSLTESPLRYPRNRRDETNGYRHRAGTRTIVCGIPPGVELDQADGFGKSVFPSK